MKKAYNLWCNFFNALSGCRSGPRSFSITKQSILNWHDRLFYPDQTIHSLTNSSVSYRLVILPRPEVSRMGRRKIRQRFDSITTDDRLDKRFLRHENNTLISITLRVYLRWSEIPRGDYCKKISHIRLSCYGDFISMSTYKHCLYFTISNQSEDTWIYLPCTTPLFCEQVRPPGARPNDGRLDAKHTLTY